VMKFIIPDDTNKIKRQINLLKWQIENDTREKDVKIHTVALNKLQGELLFRQYLELQSEEYKKDLIGYEHFEQPDHDLIIKVNFTWGWLRVYRTKGGSIEWY